MKICTWNLWFSSKCQDGRMKECARVLLEYNPDVVCLQEVKQSIKNSLMTEDLSAKYDVFADEHSTEPYGNMFLVKKERRFGVNFFFSMEFPYGIGSKMHRRIYFLVLSNGITLLNVHLESVFNGPKGLKAHQLEYLLGYARVMSKSSTRKIFIIGDTNLSEEDNKVWAKNMIEKNGFRDIYDFADEFTYDYLENTNITGEFRSRLDRFLCSDPTVNVSSYKLLGTVANVLNDGEMIHPSDHFGVQIELTL